MTKFKYPRTPHLPDSVGVKGDDIKYDRAFWAMKAEVVVTEKMDGENTTIGPNFCHARSTDESYHWSRTWVKNFAAEWQWDLKDNERICGENMYAKHTIAYKDLPSYFLGFSYWDGIWCYDWDTTLKKFKDCNIQSVPVLFEGSYSKWLNADKPPVREGYVVRSRCGFTYDDFGNHVRKWVGPEFVIADEHWMNAPQITNHVVDSSHC